MSSPTSSQARLNQPFAFVVGCPRSGTTLLLRMLDAHTKLAVANDTHFIPRVLELNRPASVAEAIAGKDIELTGELADAVWEYHRFQRLGITRDQWQEARCDIHSYSVFVSRLYQLFAANQSKSLAVEKTPDYVRHIPLLHALFPAAKFVHIVRDGRDVALSLRDWAHKEKGPGRLGLWDEQPLATCAIWWEWLVATGRRDGSQLPSDQYFELSYETLLEDPEATMASLCAYLRIAYDASMHDYHQGRQCTKPGLSAKQAWLPPTVGLRSWRNQMCAEDVALFEALAGSTLSQCGYALAASQPASEATVEVARESRAWWDAFLTRRDEKCQRRVFAKTPQPSETSTHAFQN